MSKENYAKVKELLKAFNESQKASNDRKLWKKKELKKKRIRLIEDAFDTVTYKAGEIPACAIDDELAILDHYKLLADYSLNYSDKEVIVCLHLTELGKQVAALLYSGGLPPLVGSSSDSGDEYTTFKDYEDGYCVATFIRESEEDK
jgi:hypothetical protein